MSTIVLTVFTTSEAYKADINVINEGMQQLSAIDGVLANYHGIQIENNNTGYTIEVATEAAANTDLLANVAKTTDLGSFGDMERYRLCPVTDPFKALVGPVTEVCFVSLKNPTPENKQVFETVSTGFAKALEEKWTFGWSLEDSNKAVIIAAWDSVEAHMERLSQPGVADSLKEFLELIESHGGPRHVELKKV